MLPMWMRMWFQNLTLSTMLKQIREFAATENAEVVVISARAEEEISELDDEDKQEFLEALGLTESGVDKLTRAAYHLLGLGTYFTAGEKKFALGPLNVV